MLHDSIYVRNRKVKLVGSGNRMAVAKAWEEGARNSCPKGIKS